jgi:hypothetical protein
VLEFLNSFFLANIGSESLLASMFDRLYSEPKILLLFGSIRSLISVRPASTPSVWLELTNGLLSLNTCFDAIWAAKKLGTPAVARLIGMVLSPS